MSSYFGAPPLDLIQRIRTAFPDPGFPDRRTCPHVCDECDELDLNFRGKQWAEIAELPMLPLNAATSLLSDEEFGYFLPALMTGVLRDPEEADVMVDSIAYSFLASSSRHGVIEIMPRLQREAVYGYLRWWIKLEGDANWSAKIDALVERFPPDGKVWPQPI